MTSPQHGATLIVSEHDLVVIRSDDWIVDMGPEDGKDNGRVIASGTPREIKDCLNSITGRHL